jgi:hypothetical protein
MPTNLPNTSRQNAEKCQNDSACAQKTTNFPESAQNRPIMPEIPLKFPSEKPKVMLAYSV